MSQTAEVLDDREDRSTALDKFARADEGRARGEVIIPPNAFPATGERIIGAQTVAVYRDETRVLQKLKALAAAAGSDWYYRFPVQNRKEQRTDWIEGPSIKLANDLARIYGNCDVDVRVMDLGDSWLFYARFTDFETGFSLTRPFQQRKNASKMGGADEGRRLDIALQIGASKAIRNVVTNALQTFSDFAFEEARGALVEKIGTKLQFYREKTAARFAEMGIDLKRVETIRGRALADWLAPDIAMTIAEIKAVQDGMASADETWPALDKEIAEKEPAKTEPKTGLDEFAAGEKAATDPASAPAEAAAADAPSSLSPVAAAEPSDKDEIAAEGRAAFGKGVARRAVPGDYRGKPEADWWLDGFDAAKAEKAQAEQEAAEPDAA